MSDECYFVGDTGTKIILDVGDDISAATTLEMKYKKPDGTTGTWTAAEETSTTISYTTQAGDWDQAGQWTVQAYIELPAWSGYGCKATFELKAPLA